MISVYSEQWSEFQDNCSCRYKTASGVIRELILEWNKKCQKEREIQKVDGKNLHIMK